MQDEFKAVFEECDEAEFFDQLSAVQVEIMDTAKNFRRLKGELAKRGSAMKAEAEQLSKFWEVQTLMCRFNRLLQLLCENHNTWQQNYLRDQRDNQRSLDVLSTTVEVLNRLCKNTISMNNEMDEQELLVLVSGVNLLTEMMQGPCMENQQQLAVNTQVIEVFMRILGVKFKLISILDTDADARRKVRVPQCVRDLKAKVCICMNAMSEGRAASDTSMHQAVL